MIHNIKNKKILVTGGTGQIGSFLVEELVKKEANVFVIGRNKKNLKEINFLIKSKKVTFLECDLINNNKYNIGGIDSPSNLELIKIINNEIGTKIKPNFMDSKNKEYSFIAKKEARYSSEMFFN